MKDKIKRLKDDISYQENTINSGQTSDIPIFQLRATLLIAQALSVIAEILQESEYHCKLFDKIISISDPRPNILSKK